MSKRSILTTTSMVLLYPLERPLLLTWNSRTPNAQLLVPAHMEIAELLILKPSPRHFSTRSLTRFTLARRSRLWWILASVIGETICQQTGTHFIISKLVNSLPIGRDSLMSKQEWLNGLMGLWTSVLVETGQQRVLILISASLSSARSTWEVLRSIATGQEPSAGEFEFTQK